MVLWDLTLYCLVYPGLTFLALFLYLGMVQKRSRSSRCSCHPDRLSSMNIVSHQLRLGYSIYNTWLGKYIHTWKLAEASNNKHTNTTQINLCENCSILPVPFLEDNYSYLICCHNTGHVAAVDAGDAAAIEAAMQQLVVPETCPRPHLTTLLTTHGHWDHDGGNQELLAENAQYQCGKKHAARTRIAGGSRPSRQLTCCRRGPTTSSNFWIHT